MIGFYAAGAMGQQSGPPPSGFPVYLSGTPYYFDTAATSQGITLPAVSNGDMLIIQVGTSNGTITAPGGAWTSLANDGTGSAAAMRTVYKICDGTEGGTTLTIATSASVRMAAIAHRIQAGTFDPSSPPEATTANGLSTTPDPPSETASWGAANNLFLAIANARSVGNTESFTSPFSDNHVTAKSASGSGTAYSGCASCTLDSTNATENPGTFSTGVSNSWKAFTIVVKPAP